MNYSTTVRECLAVVWATSKFRPYIFGTSFTIVTDHHSLCWLLNIKDPSGRLARWSLRLQEFDFSIRHKSGKKHLDADGLSRGPVVEGQLEDTDYDPITITTLKLLNFDDDGYIKKIKNLLINKVKNSIGENFKIDAEMLYKRNPSPIGEEWLLVIPESNKKSIMEEFHDQPTSGHLGIKKTLDKIKRRFFWPGLADDLIEYINSCRKCHSRKKPTTRVQGLLQPIPPAEFPFQRVGIDLLGPLVKTKSGNRWIVVTTDYFTRYAETGALKTGTAEDVSDYFLQNIILRHGSPHIVLSDQGRQFMSKLFSQVTFLCDAVHKRTTPYHPQTNGLTERMNKTLAEMISMYINEKHDNWDAILPYVTFAYNTSIQSTTGYSPHFLMYGREPQTIFDTLIHRPQDGVKNDYDEYVQNMVDTAGEAMKLAKKRTLSSQEYDKKRYDRSHKHVVFAPGELVWLWCPTRKIGQTDKFQKNFYGPYKIMKQLSEVNFVIIPTTGKIKEQVVHCSRLKKFVDRV